MNRSTIDLWVGIFVVIGIGAVVFTGSPIEALYGAAVLYLLIKVPGLMNAAAHLESKTEHLAEGVAKRAVKGAMATRRATGA